MIIFLSFLNLSGSDSYSWILNDHDLILEKQQDRPTLSALPTEPHWESYNLWQCFPMEAVKIDCIEEIVRFVAFSNGEFYEFSFFQDYPPTSCNQRMKIWNPFLERQQTICFYAAHFYDSDVPPEENLKRHSYWIIDHFKTLAGQSLPDEY